MDNNRHIVITDVSSIYTFIDVIFYCVIQKQTGDSESKKAARQTAAAHKENPRPSIELTTSDDDKPDHGKTIPTGPFRTKITFCFL